MYANGQLPLVIVACEERLVVSVLSQTLNKKLTDTAKGSSRYRGRPGTTPSWSLHALRKKLPLVQVHNPKHTSTNKLLTLTDSAVAQRYSHATSKFPTPKQEQT